MKRTLFIFILLACCQLGNAQPDIQKNIYIAEKHCWNDFQYTNHLGYGSTFLQTCYVPTVGLYAVTAISNALHSSSGKDFMIYRINPVTYDTLWSKVYGGSKDEDQNFYQLRVLPNGHLLVAGRTQSFDMNFIDNPFQGGIAVFFMELDTAGIVLRTKILNSNSGFSGTTLRDVIIDSFGNIYATGDTWNDNMDFAHVANGKDGWILKLDTAFNKEWMRFWIGYDSDQPGGLGFINNGNIAVTGVTGDTGTVQMLSQLDQGQGDLYIEAYSPQGVTLWNGRFGGKEFETGRKVWYDSTSNQLWVIGLTWSATGDIGYHTAKVSSLDSNRLETQNIWLLKLDTMGNLIHSKTYGSRSYGIYTGQETHYETSIWHNDKLWMAVRTVYGGGDFDSIFVNGSNKILIATFDSNANLTSKYNMNETSEKFIHSFYVKNNRLLATGYSVHHSVVPFNAFSCDSSANNLNFIMGFDQAPLGLNSYEKVVIHDLFNIYPNPSQNMFEVQLSTAIINKENSLTIINSTGDKILRQTLVSNHTKIDCSSWTEGLYFINVRINGRQQSRTFLKY